MFSYFFAHQISLSCKALSRLEGIETIDSTDLDLNTDFVGYLQSTFPFGGN